MCSKLSFMRKMSTNMGGTTLSITAFSIMTLSIRDLFVALSTMTFSAITNGREPRSRLSQVFNFKLGSFT
jgi:hypothetical protein